MVVVSAWHRAAARGAVLCENSGGLYYFLHLPGPGLAHVALGPQNDLFFMKNCDFAPVPRPPCPNPAPHTPPTGGTTWVQAQCQNAHGAEKLNLSARLPRPQHGNRNPWPYDGPKNRPFPAPKNVIKSVVSGDVYKYEKKNYRNDCLIVYICI